MSGTIALIVAAGSGSRAVAPGMSGDLPKQYRDLAGSPVLRHTVGCFASQLGPDAIFTVIRPPDRELYRSATRGMVTPEPIMGGARRQDSVRLGLEAVAARASPGKVLIHDAARPFVSAAVISRVIDGLNSADAVAPMVPVPDTLRRKEAGLFSLVPRDELYRTQTPQGFAFDAILAAHRRYAAETFTDDIALAERAGLRVIGVPGEEMNIKLTTPSDFEIAQRLAVSALPDIRTGTGFDVHRFAHGNHVWLCGIKIPHDFGLEGHSDADAGLHALTDALLGAIGAGDIGSHFPPTEEKWRGADSSIFLDHAAKLVRELGGTIAHTDITLICERPKIGPHRDGMRRRIADILAIPVERVSVKATTTEGLGFTGRREGLAAQAVATIRLPVR
ncbi:MAG TPA: bifunctional 2-C-methyl-D-erythritol 4-phosphate cytidylyltransferase/2-C-methyl-D-erythritol 2,4-cyclodiphosphate synthase [Micropepsaceae bacterium]|nr:bifunctional 2-C-methyl-D-erythritol 4-phosphate cytidylyltransferase/2-C-methyl-D-erythritol 2,4-cyclodiphosphate synthase [Micropepsaceae bacterium]